MKLTVDTLRALPVRSELLWHHSSGRSHRAILMRQDRDSLFLHVFLDDKRPSVRRWSLRTNKPIKEYGGTYLEKVWLELPESNSE